MLNCVSLVIMRTCVCVCVCLYSSKTASHTIYVNEWMEFICCIQRASFYTNNKHCFEYFFIWFCIAYHIFIYKSNEYRAHITYASFKIHSVWYVFNQVIVWVPSFTPWRVKLKSFAICKLFNWLCYSISNSLELERQQKKNSKRQSNRFFPDACRKLCWHWFA